MRPWPLQGFHDKATFLIAIMADNEANDVFMEDVVMEAVPPNPDDPLMPQEIQVIVVGIQDVNGIYTRKKEYSSGFLYLKPPTMWDGEYAQFCVVRDSEDNQTTRKP